MGDDEEAALIIAAAHNLSALSGDNAQAAMWSQVQGVQLSLRSKESSVLIQGKAHIEDGTSAQRLVQIIQGLAAAFTQLGNPAEHPVRSALAQSLSIKASGTIVQLQAQCPIAALQAAHHKQSEQKEP